MKSSDLLNLLDAPGGENYSDTFYYEQVRKSISNAYQYLSDERVYNYTRTVSKRQYTEATIVLDSLMKGELRNAYHSLWDVIDDMGRGRKDSTIITASEHILYYSLVQNFMTCLNNDSFKSESRRY